MTLMDRRRGLLAAASGESVPEWLSNISGITAFSLENATISDNITLNFGNTNVSGFTLKKITVSKPDTVIEIKCGTLSFENLALDSESKTTKAWTLKLSCQNNPVPTSEFTHSGSVTRIIGKEILDTAPGAGGYRHWNSTKLIEVYFVANKIASTCVVTTGTLIDDSVISLINALKEGLETQQTLTISNSATKAKLATILGTVSEVTNDTETYHVFTKDPQGDTTLQTFATTTKGWVIA